ncbi:MAG: cyclase family protein [Firmicutes bacterium]|nr:cyclase family protein [Bacillota bacterium]
MKLYDITQELLGSVVFPGDPIPERKLLKRIEDGDVCNLSYLQMCAHNGTHVDAPRHFVKDGITIDQIPLEIWIGNAYVAEFTGDIGADEIKRILSDMDQAAEKASLGPVKKLLIKGKATLTLEAAEVLAGTDLELFGNESQTVGPEESPVKVHQLLLGRGMVFLEGIRLGKVPEGIYLLNAAPINVAGSDGSPCRAVLIEL